MQRFDAFNHLLTMLLTKKIFFVDHRGFRSCHRKNAQHLQTGIYIGL